MIWCGWIAHAFRLRAQWMERSFALTLDRGGMRRSWLRGRASIHKRCLIHVARYSLGLIMRLLTGAVAGQRHATSEGSRLAIPSASDAPSPSHAIRALP